MSEMERKIEIILETVTEVKETNVGMQERMDGMQERMDGMQERMDGMQGSIIEMKENMTGMQRSISELQQITRSLRDGQEETEAKLDALGSDVETMRIDLNAVKNNMVTKDDLVYFDRKIGEHDRELDKLKQRV